ncbi:glycosyltransferase family 2 protein [Aridibaculum aurantiacum]|uniref:glycosyltransferase family 2 protein n=1 Tax=Aridibaculum aurantiacum TaxID=2810307 RepID=UPI001A96557C|nr:glycosyltransferase family 2 protein [Aridibaculum aurantiacum]
MKLPRVSIITAVYNACSTIEATIQNVLELQYPDIEYIVIDGGSTDGTLEIIENYKSHINVLVSEKDNGVFDAMNKGIARATGTWVNFMNAGDTFCSESIIGDLQLQQYPEAGIVYGDTLVAADGSLVPAFSVASLPFGQLMTCHQSMFFNRVKLQDKLKYVERYKVYGDLKLVIDIYKTGAEFVYVPLPVASYLRGGLSSIASWQNRKFKYSILFKEYGLEGLAKGILDKLQYHPYKLKNQ